MRTPVRERTGDTFPRLYYLDGRIRFERYCYGEAACLVFSVWGHGIDADGKLLWDREPEFESQQTSLPRYLTDVQEDGKALQFDGARKRYILTEELIDCKYHFPKYAGLINPMIEKTKETLNKI